MHGEHHIQAPTLLRISLVLPVAIFGGLWHFVGLDPIPAAKVTAQLLASYWAALWTGVLMYRIFFHRLNNS
jgi:tryprostatin B 6-hydroxylase